MSGDGIYCGDCDFAQQLGTVEKCSLLRADLPELKRWVHLYTDSRGRPRKGAPPCPFGLIRSDRRSTPERRERPRRSRSTTKLAPEVIFWGLWRRALQGLPGLKEAEGGFRVKSKHGGVRWGLIVLHGATARLVVGLQQRGPYRLEQCPKLAEDLEEMMKAHDWIMHR